MYKKIIVGPISWYFGRVVLSVKPSRTYMGSIPTKFVRPVKRATPKNAFGLAPLGIETANPEITFSIIK